MRDSQPSWTAQHVTLARSHLSWMGVLDDGLAEAMLRRPWAVAGGLLRRGPLTGLGRNWSFAHVAARTCFFDDHVLRALDDGVSQVVVIGAGYDSRAWPEGSKQRSKASPAKAVRRASSKQDGLPQVRMPST